MQTRTNEKPQKPLHTGTWSPAEDGRLREAVAKHGTRWVAVANEVGTRNGDQCAKRWNENLNPDLDHSPWTAREDKLLLHLVEVYGHNWKFMANGFLEARAPLALKNRYSLLMRRLKRQGAGKQLSSSSTSGNTSPTVSFPSQFPTSFDHSSGTCTPFPFEDGESGNNSPFRGSLSGTEGEITRPNSLDLTNMFGATTVGTTDQSMGNHQHLPTAFGSMVAGDHHYSHDTAPITWDDQVFFGSDALTGDGSGHSGYEVDNASNGTAMLVRHALETGRHPEGGHDQIQSAVAQNSADNAIEYSITCQRGKLKKVVHHLVDAAVSDTSASSAGDPVTMTLRLKSQ
ncbi:hypothetical protein F4779DRAFT_619834 [Xylariaceae sp. FL0662B]|nr:hypothetical protein F4779DRAFT_619834 [Xylariaceae sp. FL0662B]